ncbi:MAG TPA: EAL domain-containing protein [Thermoanaerobaculia bacterium]|jgi:diguanylate cyclase (GGDEF)-like protein/PAS domain S-box-containing protein
MLPIAIVVAAALVALAVVIAARQLARARGGGVLRDTNRFAAEIIDNAGEGIVVYDRDLRYILWNRFMEELTGMPASVVVGQLGPELFPHLREQQVDDLIRRAFSGETVSSPDIHYYVPQNGKQGWVSSVYRPHYDAAGNVIGVIGLIRDITERKTAEQQIEYQAYHDALTGLANRRLFQEHLSLALALAQRRQTLVAVLFLDLDHFKLINDSLGHTVGDELLKQVAKRLKSAVREGDTVARVGGDEFTIVLQELNRGQDAALVAKKVLRTVSEPIEVNGHRLYVTTSVGITLFPDDGEDAETLLKNADTAMYRAKAEGRNTYQMSTQELSRSTHERMTVESGLHRALEAGEFELLYQPQLDVSTEQIVGMEALLRWRHPERGVIAPEEFIGVAEERGLILGIGNWVVCEACRAVRRFHDRGHRDFRVAVNISARQFRDPALLSNIESAIREAGIDARTLEIEITESVAMDDVQLTMSTLTELRKSGVTIAIDDFGTGHSSLSYIKRFPIDALKIDRAFVTDLPDGFEDAAIVSSVISLANGLGMRVIAEGVETREQLDFLRENGCREVQGFYFSYPVELDEVERLLGASKVRRQER